MLKEAMESLGWTLAVPKWEVTSERVDSLPALTQAQGGKEPSVFCYMNTTYSKVIATVKNIVTRACVTSSSNAPSSFSIE